MSTPLTYSIEQAAARLGHVATADWLRHHLDEIPHVKSGKGSGRAGRVAFTEGHLAEILAMLEKRPEASPAPSDPSEFKSIASRPPRRTRGVA